MEQKTNDGPLLAPAEETPELSRDGGVPDWLRAMTPDDVALDLSVPAPAEEIPDWLKQMTPQVPEYKAPEAPAPVLAVASREPPNTTPPEEPPSPPIEPSEAAAKTVRRERQVSAETEIEFFGKMRGVRESAEQAARIAEPFRLSLEDRIAVEDGRKIAVEQIDILETTTPSGVIEGVARERKLTDKQLLENKIGRFRASMDDIDLRGLQQQAKTAARFTRVKEFETKAAEQLAKQEHNSLAGELESWEAAETRLKRPNGHIKEDHLRLQLDFIEQQKLTAKTKFEQAKIEWQTKNLAWEEANKQAEKAQAERAKNVFAVRGLHHQVMEARGLISQIEAELTASDQISDETKKAAEDFRSQIRESDGRLMADRTAKDLAAVTDVFAQLDPGFVHPDGVEADLLQALHEGFPGTQIERDYIFALSQRPEYANMTIPQLQEVFRDRVGRMNRILELESAGSPEEMVSKLMRDPAYPELPESFKQAVAATLKSESFLPDLPEGSDRVFSQLVRAQRKAYSDVLSALGLKPMTPESVAARQVSEEKSLGDRLQSGELARQFAELYAGEPLPPELQNVSGDVNEWAGKVSDWAKQKLEGKLAAEAQTKEDAEKARAEAERLEKEEMLRAQGAEDERLKRSRDEQLTRVTQMAEENERAERANLGLENMRIAAEKISAATTYDERKAAESELAANATALAASGVADDSEAAMAGLQDGLTREVEQVEDSGLIGRAAKIGQDFLLNRITPEQAKKSLRDLLKYRKGLKTVEGTAADENGQKAADQILAAIVDSLEQLIGRDQPDRERVKGALTEPQAKFATGRISELAAEMTGLGFAGFGLVNPLIQLAISSMFPQR